MPNYSLVVDATYDPMTYQEISAPVKESAAFHQALQDKYDEMRMSSELYGAYIPDDEENAEARRRFNAYMDWLNKGTDTLMRNGAWGQRDLFSNVRASYARDMMPVQAAYKLRKDEATAQQTALAKNPLLEFSHDAQSSGLDYYLNHPEGGYKIVDPTTVTGIVAAKAKSFLSQLRGNPDQAIRLEKTMGLPEGYLSSIVQYGLSADDIMNWRSNPVLRGIMSEALGAYGMGIDDNGFGVGNNTWSQSATDRVIAAAASGFAAGAGKDDVSIIPDQFAMQAMKNAAKGAGSGSGSGNGYDAPWVRNDHTWTVGDSLTNGTELDKLQNAAAMLGITYDKDTNTFTYNPHTLSGGIDALQGRFSNMIPFRRSADEIFEEIAAANGWTYTPAYGHSAAGMFTKNGKPVPKTEVATALGKQAENAIGRYHSVQDVSLNDYNQSLKGTKVYPVSKINKDGTYYTDDKKATSIGAVLADKDAGSVQIGVSSTASNNGLMLKVTKDNKEQHYFIKTESISDGSIKSAIQAVNRAAANRERIMKQKGITSDEFYRLAEDAYNYQTPNEELNAQLAYRNAVLALQEAIGGTNTISTTNLNS